MSKRSPEEEYQRVTALYEQQRQAGAAVFVIGVDEVGRGSVAGPLTVAAIALPLEPMIMGLDDSKKLTAIKRKKLAAQIEQTALASGISHIEPEIIDRIGMAASLRSAMTQAIEACAAARGGEPGLVLIDGRPMGIHPMERCIVKGDSKIACICAASIVAKVTRDALMITLDAEYPDYGLASNKGYASSEHIAAIQTSGLTPVHRRTFCQSFLQQRLF